MEEHPTSQEEYVRRVLDAYRSTPGTTGTIRRADRILAAQLHQRGVALMAVENALVLAATRRLIRPAEAPPLGTIRSLAYFVGNSGFLVGSPPVLWLNSHAEPPGDRGRAAREVRAIC